MMKLHAKVDFEGRFLSEVVGIDRYQLEAQDGVSRSWVSYTLTSQQNQPFDRWYIVDFPDPIGLYLFIFSDVKDLPDEAQIFLPLSGLAKVKAEGDALWQSETAQLNCREQAGVLYGLEELDDGTTLMMTGHQCMWEQAGLIRLKDRDVALL